MILVGSVAKSKRFRSQLRDAVQSLTVDFPQNPAAQMGPMIAPPKGKLEHGLTKLDRGERWFIEPKQLSEDGKLWSPGVRDRVRFGATSHKVEYFGPVLAIMTAKNLEQAIKIQNAVDYGLTAGLHSLSPEEINIWLEKVQAGNVYVNRGITGAIVRRQSFGGWKKSAVGPTAKAGGPNYLFCLTDWKSTSNNAKEPIGQKLIEELMVMATASTLTDKEVESLVRAAQSDVAAKAEYFSKAQDESGLTVEKNILRYFRSDCTIRIQPAATEYQVWRSLITALALGAAEVSVDELPNRVLKFVRKAGLSIKLETEEAWLLSLSESPRRVRVVGGVNRQLPELSNVDVAVFDSEQTESGIIELLPFYKEQAVSITAHRFGNPARHLSLVRI